MVEIIGYVASVFVALSLVMVSLVKLRVINLVGSSLFTVYGIVIQAWPIVLTNGFIVIVNLFYLYRMFRKDVGRFEYNLLVPSEADLVVRFLQEKVRDCQRYYPLFHPKMISFAFGGSGYVYGAFRSNRLNGISVILRMDRILEFSPVFWPESPVGRSEDGESASSSAPDDAYKNKELIVLVEELSARYAPKTTYFMPADYLVAKYRDLGVVGRFHSRLLADLPAEVERIVCAVNRSDMNSRRYFQRNGYEKVLSTGELTVFELDLKDLRRN